MVKKKELINLEREKRKNLILSLLRENIDNLEFNSIIIREVVDLLDNIDYSKRNKEEIKEVVERSSSNLDKLLEVNFLLKLELEKRLKYFKEN